MLEADEMKQLLNNETEFDNEKESLTQDEKILIEKILKEPLKKACDAFGKVIGEEANIDNINLEIVNASLLGETLDRDTYYMQDIEINNKLTTFITDIATIKKVNVIVTEEISADEILSAQETAMWEETINQTINSFTSELSKTYHVEMNMKLEKEKESELLTKERMLQISFSLKSVSINTTIYYVVSYEIINQIIDEVRKKAEKEAADSIKTENDVEPEEINATVQPIKFEEFKENFITSEKENMSLLMDLQLQVSVELGKVKKPIKDILQFTQGTIVELDRLAGENVDILVSGKIIAKGEVVVVDQNFGVRITQIVIPEKRV